MLQAPMIFLFGRDPSQPGWSTVAKSNNLTISGAAGQIVTRTSVASGTVSAVRGLQGRATGKWYFETQVNTAATTSARTGVGVVTAAEFQPAERTGWGFNSVGLRGDASWDVFKNNVEIAANLSAVATGDVICARCDFGASTVAFRRNGGSWSSDYGLAAGQTYYPHVAFDTFVNYAMTLNTGQSAFAQAVPSGFEAWATG